MSDWALYPAGAANDPDAPYNLKTRSCWECEEETALDCLDEHGVCDECNTDEDTDPPDWTNGAIDPDSKYADYRE